MCMAVAVPMFTSCVDTDEIWNKIDELELRLDSLETQLNSQVEAMASLLEDGSTVSSCKKNEDGSYVVTLSNGTKFTVLPDGTNYSTFVTYAEVNGKKCWATYGPDGQPVVLKDAAGNAIPVSVEATVEVKDGIYYLMINGVEYPTGIDAAEVVQVFSSCEPLEDASGNVYAIKFTFGDGQEVTVALDGYAGVIFRLSSTNRSVISDYYVGYGETQSFLMETEGVIDYVMQVPDGWRVKEVYDALMDETYLEVTAPVKETVDMGAAVAEGDLKVVSVVEGGKASVSKMYLSTSPFKTYNVSKIKAVVAPYTGIQKFAYGLMYFDDFDKATVISKVTEILTTSADLPAGYNVSDKGIDLMYEDIFGEELDAQKEYVFWVIPALYREETDEEEAGFYVDESMLQTKVIAPISAKIEISNVTLLDAQVKVRVGGTLSTYAGAIAKSDNALADIAYQINNEIVEPTDVLEYNGPVSEFPSGETSIYLEPATTYIAWVVPVDPEKTTYLASDVIYKEFTTPGITSGGTLTTTIGNFTATPSSLTATVSSADAAMFYYAFLSDVDGDRLKNESNEDKLDEMKKVSSFTSARGTSVNAVLNGLRPETTMWLYAVAVGHDGKYGDVICKSGTTGSVSFNNLSVSIVEKNVGSDKASFTISASGATEFIYWCGLANDQFWTNPSQCAGTEADAGKYIAANPDAQEIASVMRKNGAIASDGSLTIKDLSLATEHVLVVLAKDASGKYSQAKAHKFTTTAADFGDLVTADTDTRKTTKQWIQDNITWNKSSFKGGNGNGQGSASYSFSIKTPTDLRAYITCYGTEATRTADIMLEIETLCTKSMPRSTSLPEDVDLPTWKNELDGRDISTGGMFNYYVTYLHGEPDDGYVTYFPSSGHVNCASMDNGECTSYKAFKEEMARITSFDYWYEYIKDFANQEKWGRKQSDDAVIVKAAQDYAALYTKYFGNAEPIIYVNNGDALTMRNTNAAGLDEQGNVIDKVTVVLVDANGNYWEPMYINVPNFFK